MSFTKMQKSILCNTTAAKKVTPRELAVDLQSKPGPIARSAHSLVEQGMLVSGETKDGETFFKRTAEGGKAAKKL